MNLHLPRQSTFLSLALIVMLPTLAPADDVTIRLRLDGRQVEGHPVAWSDAQVLLLGRDGHLWNFAPSQARDFQKVSDRFRSYSQAEIRGQLLREYGQQFDVSGTGHYLVVHPRGRPDQWAARFEALYRQFVHYFTARGWRLTAPRFPLVAVVCHDRQDFARLAARDGVNVGGGVLGYYSPNTNRVLLYDATAGDGSNADWSANAETIIHEATHQTAFNTGIHSRFAMQPKWLAEGLATMFEARGVYDSGRYRGQHDRLNPYRLDRFLSYAKTRRRRGAMEQLIASDRLFASDGDAAYAEAWALTFYLAERHPREYFQLLSKVAARPPLEPYTSARRLQDFRSVLGDDLAMLEVRMLRFVEGLK